VFVRACLRIKCKLWDTFVGIQHECHKLSSNNFHRRYIELVTDQMKREMMQIVVNIYLCDIREFDEFYANATVILCRFKWDPEMNRTLLILEINLVC
jgi:hypothetical protein